jgi:uncharacterized protein YjbJ (UPF0337 family)
MMNENQAEGKFDKVKGDVKQAVGDATDDPSLQAEGTWDKVKGGAKEAIGDVQDALDDDPA